MATLDGSIVNVALPKMADELNVSMAEIEWVVTSFLIIIAATILIFGRLGDIKGKIKIFKFGVVIFTIGSFLCGLTDSLIVLVIARAIQAIGAAATMATNQGIITQVFPSNERGRALGILGTFVALGAMAGPPLGGFIVSAVSWKYIFLVNVPVGIVAFILIMRIFPKSNKVIDEKLDGKGALLFTIFIVALFGALVQGQSIGYDNLAMISAFVLSAIAFITFIIVENKEELPLLQLKIFKNSLFSVSIVCAVTSFVAISASNIILPFYFQDVLKMTTKQCGLFMMVSPIVLSVVAPFSGYLSDKIGSEILTFIGLTVTSIGLLLISSLNENSSLVVLVTFIVIMSIGNGMFQSPNNSLVMSTVSKDKLGIAGSVNSLVRNFAMVLGTSLATLILYNRMSYKIGYRVVDYVNGRNDVFVYGMKYVYIFAAIICGIGAIITALRLYYSKKAKINHEPEIEIKEA
jgi:EmrB/QacA subfamily drug resistance transporter